MKWKKSIAFVIKIFAVIALCILGMTVIVTGEALFYQTVYIDSLLAMLAAFGLATVYQSKRLTMFNVLQLTVTLSFILLTKQMGLFFVVLILGALVLNYVLEYRDILDNDWRKYYTRQNLFKMLGIVILLVVIPYGLAKVWNIYTENWEVTRQFSVSEINLNTLLGIIQDNKGEAWQYQAYINYRDTFVSQQLNDWAFPLNYLQTVAFLLILLFILGKYGKAFLGKYQLSSMMVVGAGGSLCYAFAMLLLYIYGFGSYEGPRTVCYSRYMNTYCMAILLMIIMLFYEMENRKEDTVSTRIAPYGIIIAAIIICFSNTAGLREALDPAFVYSSESTDYLEEIELVQNYTEEQSKIFLVSQNSNSFINYLFSYETSPRTYNISYYSLGKPYYSEDVFTKDIEPKELTEMLSDYDYFFLQSIDEQFLETYSELFQTGQIIESGQLYKIVHNQVESKLELSLVV